MSDPLLLIVLPLAGALVMLVLKLLSPALQAGALRALALVPFPLMAVVLAVSYPAVAGGTVITHALGGFPEPVGIALYLDGSSWLSAVLITTVTFLVALASLSGSSYTPAYYFFLLVMTAGMAVVSLTGDLFTMFVGFEIVAIAAYVLIAWDRTDQALLASLKYLFLSSVGILFFLLGIYLTYRSFGVLSIALITEKVQEIGGGAVDPAVRTALVLLVVGVGVRTAFIPFHTWLPEAHAYAPHPVSALLSGVLIKISFFALIRILNAFDGYYLYELFLWIGGVTALVAVVQAMAQTDVKRLLAYHSISQMGYILAAVGSVAVGSAALSVTAAWVHAINHALFKSLLFLGVGTAVVITGERDVYRMRAVGRRAPIVAVAIAVGALGITGIPPFNGFGSKYLIGYALKGNGVYPLLWAASVGTVASFMKLSRIIGSGRNDTLPPAQEGEHLSFAIVVPLALFAVLVLFLGITAQGWARWIGNIVTGTAVLPLPSFYSTEALMGTLPVLFAGAVLYRLIHTARGTSVTHRIRSFSPHLRTVLVFFMVGLILFSAVASI